MYPPWLQRASHSSANDISRPQLQAAVYAHWVGPSAAVVNSRWLKGSSEAYVHGFMDGGAIELQDREGSNIRVQKFDLE